jgi:hypothetical protein
MERKIIFSTEANVLLKELLLLLYAKGYFSFWNNAREYVKQIVYYIVQYAYILNNVRMPRLIFRYGSNLKYITYRANKTTTWYIFYQQQDDVYLVRHITNNHVAAQYFG